jgi:hypothetical protein
MHIFDQFFHSRKNRLRLNRPSGGGFVFELGKRQFASSPRRPILVGRSDGYVDIFKNGARGDAACPVGGFDQIIAYLTAMFPPERVHEHERLGKLFGPDKKSRAIDLPLTAGIH